MSKLIKTTCEQCGKEITYHRRRPRRFCSMKCMGLWRSEHWQGSNSPRWQGGNITKVCEICGQPFDVYPSIANRARYCSRACMRIAQSRQFSGSGNPAYKGGTSVYTNGKKSKTSYRYIRGQSDPIAEHRYVMEQVLGRKLEPSEEVHHINGDTLDNRPENLFVLDKKHHARKHFQLFKQVQELERENELLKEKLASISSQVPQ